MVVKKGQNCVHVVIECPPRCMCSFMFNSQKNLEWYLVLQPSLILFSLMFGLVLFVVFLLVELLLGLKVKRKTISIHCTGILFSNSIDCDVKIRKIPVPYPDLFLSIYKYLFFLLLTVFLSRLFFVLYKFS